MAMGTCLYLQTYQHLTLMYNPKLLEVRNTLPIIPFIVLDGVTLDTHASMYLGFLMKI